jgi:ATP-binding cassette subfamily C protein CydD
MAWSALVVSLTLRRRERCGATLLALPLPSLESLGPGAAVGRVLDAPQAVAQGAVAMATALLRDGLTVGVLSVTALALRPRLFVLVLLVWVVVLGLLRRNARRQDRGASRRTVLRDRVSSWAAALPPMAPVAAAQGAIAAVTHGLGEDLRALGSLERNRAWLAALSSPAAELLGVGSVVAVLALVGRPGAASLDATVGFFYVVFMAWRSLRGLGVVQLQVSNGRRALADLTALEAQAGQCPRVQSEGEVSVQGLRARRGDSLLLRDLTLHLVPGTLVALQGPSGTGKSTALETIVGLRPADAGTREPPWGAVLACGLAPQPPPLTPGTLEHTLLLDAGTPTSRTWEVLAALDLDTWVQNLPGALQGDVGPGGIQPSTGQRQRLGVARAVLAPDRLLVLDEPTAGLGATHAEGVVGLLLTEARRGRAVLVASHDPMVLAAADVVIEVGSLHHGP